MLASLWFSSPSDAAVPSGQPESSVTAGTDIELFSRSVSFTASVTPPQARLVGVETNPGPGKKGMKKKGDNQKGRRSLRTSQRRLQLQQRIYSLYGNPRPQACGYESDNQIYSLSQTASVGTTFTTSTLAYSHAEYQFTIGALTQISSLAAVFDQYRIDWVEFWLDPTNPTVTGNPGVLMSVIDYDDANATGALGDLESYMNCMSSSGLDGHYRCFKPHAALAAYSGTFTSYANVESPWLDLASTAVAHYGIKIGSTTTGSNNVYNIVVRYHASFRNVR